MGLLDDAIREHLELKRRAGADPGEIARLEQEALGPPRRDPLASAPAQAPAAAPPGEHAPEPDWHAHEGSAHYDDEPLYEDVHEPPPGPPHPVEAEGEPAPAADQPTEQFSLGDLEDAQAAAPPRGEPGPQHEDAEEIVPADEEPGDEDVLEETPEFLQETPEHDRLWFEQKPPRDFDF